MRYIIAAFLVITGVAAATAAHAQPEPIKAAREAVIDSIERLEELKGDDSMAPHERLREETKLKRETLGFIVELSTLETENIREKLRELNPDIAFEDLREELVGATEGYVEYFEATQSLLRRTEDLDGIQRIAGQLKDWRTVTYDPGITKAVDLILVFQNQEMLGVADQRFEKLAAELKRRAAKIRQSWQPLLLRASDDLRAAHDLNDAAVELLTTYLPKDEVALEKTVDEKITLTPEAEPAPTIRDLVQQSVAKIKDAYGKFISLSDFLKR